MRAPDTMLQDRYRIAELLGRGGMGAVYRATDCKFGSTVAIKETLVTGEDLARAFEREARLLNGLRHRALPVVIDCFTEDGGQFLVMQYIPGDDLGALLEQSAGPFPPDQVLEWADQLLDALSFLHEHDPQVIHRDIKPRNLKLTPRGEVILLDFGLSKATAAEPAAAEASVSVLGYTPHYAPFEQIHGLGTGPRSDLFSLAATLYHLLTGVQPPDAVTRAQRKMSGQPDPLRPADELSPLIPRAVAALLHQTMAMAPEERPVSATALRMALQAARTAAMGAATVALAPAGPDHAAAGAGTTQPGEAGSAAPTVLRPARPRIGWRRPLAFGGVAVLVLTVVFGLSSARERAARSAPPPGAAAPAAASSFVAVPPAVRTFGFESVTLAASGAVARRHTLQGHAYEEDLGGGEAVELVAVPGGTFWMGTVDTSESDYEDEGPRHQVTIAPFYIGRYEITQAEWRAVARGLPTVRRELEPEPSTVKGDHLPVHDVSWAEAVEFCERLSRRARRRYRLPSEAEWEYAARAGTATAFAFGDVLTRAVANFDGSVPYGGVAPGARSEGPIAVGSLGIANAFGLYDVHGNVEEWCLGRYHESYEGAPADGRAWTTGGDPGHRVVRGGSWRDLAVDCRSANRYSYARDGARSTIGFRIVTALPPTAVVAAP